MSASYVYQPAATSQAATTHRVVLRLDHHPSNREAAAIMGVRGYRAIERDAEGGARVIVERFGRDADALWAGLAAELAWLTSARILLG